MKLIFPSIELEAKTDANPAIRAFGRRFYKDQTPIEYLTEFLLCFSSPKGIGNHETAEYFPELGEWPCSNLVYFPESRIALKLFSFFPSSKLETRHPVHVQRFKQLINDIAITVEADNENDKHNAVRVLQQLFSGFVGVSGQRTWVTHSFVPASQFLLSREVDWRHTDANAGNVSDWEGAEKHFSVGSHNFMARGGEVLFLQLWHIFEARDPEKIGFWLQSNYVHIDFSQNKDQLVDGLSNLIKSIDGPLAKLGGVIEQAAQQEPCIQEKLSPQNFGWIHPCSWQEAALFAWEIGNVVSSKQDPLRKIRALQDLCCLQVLRSLCFQSARLMFPDGLSEAVSGQFPGNYSWIAVAPNAGGNSDLGKASTASVSATEELLFKAIRSRSILPAPTNATNEQIKASNGDEHGFKLFRALGKQIGLIVPRTGPMRFTLSSSLVETLVAALIPAGKRVPFDVFLERLYCHFGIAIGMSQIEAALPTLNLGIRLSSQNDCANWLEDELKRGGFLISLSDATPLVSNAA